MQKKLVDGVLALANGYLQYQSAQGDCTIIFACYDPAVFDRVNNMKNMNDEYDMWVINKEEEARKVEQDLLNGIKKV